MDCLAIQRVCFGRQWLRRVIQQEQQKTLKALQDISPIDNVHYKATGSINTRGDSLF